MNINKVISECSLWGKSRGFKGDRLIEFTLEKIAESIFIDKRMKESIFGQLMRLHG